MEQKVGLVTKESQKFELMGGSKDYATDIAGNSDKLKAFVKA